MMVVISGGGVAMGVGQGVELKKHDIGVKGSFSFVRFYF